jgi:hypothetical protein
MFGKIREGFSMKVDGVHLNRPDLHNIAVELGVTTRDVLTKEGRLIVYNTSDACQEIVDDNNLASFVAMALDIESSNVSDIQSVVEEPVKLVFDLDDDEWD